MGRGEGECRGLLKQFVSERKGRQSSVTEGAKGHENSFKKRNRELVCSQRKGRLKKVRRN